MDKDPKKYLEDILAAIEEINSFVGQYPAGMMCFVTPRY